MNEACEERFALFSFLCENLIEIGRKIYLHFQGDCRLFVAMGFLIFVLCSFFSFFFAPPRPRIVVKLSFSLFLTLKSQ